METQTYREYADEMIEAVLSVVEDMDRPTESEVGRVIDDTIVIPAYRVEQESIVMTAPDIFDQIGRTGIDPDNDGYYAVFRDVIAPMVRAEIEEIARKVIRIRIFAYDLLHMSLTQYQNSLDDLDYIIDWIDDYPACL